MKRRQHASTRATSYRCGWCGRTDEFLATLERAGKPTYRTGWYSIIFGKPPMRVLEWDKACSAECRDELEDLYEGAGYWTNTVVIYRSRARGLHVTP